MGMKKSIPNFQEWKWEAGIPGNSREQEFGAFPWIPDKSHSKSFSLSAYYDDRQNANIFIQQ